ncbi:MAG TPA: LysM peptidoglycan-binding domain-containing protein [Anaerolineales bacterium]|jgi:LysM repeat protein
MSKKYILVLLVVLALTLNACTRAASSAPAATATPKTNFPKPVATSGMNAIEIAGTQTAVATAGLPMPTAAGGTGGTPGTGAIPTFTPLAGVNQTPVGATPLPSPTPGTAGTTVANTPVVIQTSVPVSNPGTYALHQGEFPYCLARRFNVNPDALLKLNGLSSGQSYYTPGTVITIPQSGGTFPGVRALKAHPAQYTVTSGDTIYSIACEFGDVDPMAIVNANNLSGSYSLTTGTTIQVP